MHQSLSSFLRAATDAHFEGPIPTAERERIRIVEGGERAFDRSLSPLERAVKSLSIGYAIVLKDRALVEASRQLRATSVAEDDARYSALHRGRLDVLAESASWLCEAARQLAVRARGEASKGSGAQGN